MPNSMDVKLSFIITARNDDYGENFLFRLKTSIKVFVYLVKKYSLPAELIIVEYNPPINTESLASALAEFKTSKVSIRIVRIPAEFHEQIRQESKTPFLEYVAKNIGLRRAKGEYIVALNPDIVLSEELVAFLAQGKLEEIAFYRADRQDLPAHSLDSLIDPASIIEASPGLVNRAWTAHGLEYLALERWSKRFFKSPSLANFILCPLFNPLRRLLAKLGKENIHVSAAGDFILAHKLVWAKLQGFDERPFLSYIDGYAVYNLTALKFKQIILPYPIFHINHKESNSQRKMLDVNEFKKDAEEILRTSTPQHQGPANWGAPDEKFQEEILSSRIGA